MTDEEAVAVHEQLNGLLRESHLEWLVQQVAREIAEGRSVITTLSAAEQLSGSRVAFERPRRRKSRVHAAEFTKIVPYTPKERLLKLIEAIDTAIRSSAAIFAHLADFLSPEQPFAINFRSDEADAAAYALSEDNLSVIKQANSRLDELLTELRREIQHDD